MGEYVRRGFDLIHEDRKITGLGGEKQWVNIIENRPKDQPFFLWYAAHDAHRDWGENKFSGTHLVDEISPPDYLIDDQPTRLDLANYYDEIKRFDYSIGSVVETLKKEKIYDNTFIIIMADNGRPFPHSKTRLNDQGVKTPFILLYKNLAADELVPSIRLGYDNYGDVNLHHVESDDRTGDMSKG